MEKLKDVERIGCFCFFCLVLIQNELGQGFQKKGTSFQPGLSNVWIEK